MITDFHKALTLATQKHMAGGPHRASAEDIYHQLIGINPNHPFLNFALGTFYTDDSKHGVAIPLLMRAVELDPKNAQAWNNLGAAFKSVFQHEGAEECLDKAYQLDPQNAAVYANYSGLYINEGCPEKCVPWAKKGLLVEPDSPQLHNHMGLALLELGQWEDAWPHWEWRMKLPGWFVRDFPAPTKKWHGQPVKSLALSGEQGIGDEIMFASIIPDIRHLVSGTIFIECTQRLQSLFERSFAPCRTYPSHQELLFHEHKIDAHLQLGSLPRLFRPTPKCCPGTPYLKPDPVALNEMRARLARLGPPPYVGIAWKGGTVKTHAHVRQTALSDWADLLKLPATFVSVQYGQAAIEASQNNIPHWADAVVDFDRHTALIAACDLVISVCQTGVHQAGALGVPCWCLTPFKVAWRYGVWGGEEMAWYKSVRLFRQGSDQNWKPVYDRVAGELRQWLESRSQEAAA